SQNRMQNKIRLAQEQKVPYMLVLGDREVAARTAAPRTRAGEQQVAEPWLALAERLSAEARDRRPS
ncbi:MAG: His/Gly/Thr/Pro-type tRNA ligase C-terminal domain-containing protein, partial [Candidatus Limnocylindrales bacterium]